MSDSLLDYLDQWVSSHPGTDAWVEQATGINKASLLLVAGTGEWTRQAVPSVDWAREFARGHEIASYDAGLVAYPQRMRDWDITRKRADKIRRSQSSQ